jgi:adenylyltransferase/sulfurtransferase
MLSDQQLMRYNRQILLHDFDIAGQERLQRATVLVVGLGGLGCPAAMYLGAAGVGRLILADGDSVELSNLQRQIAHASDGLGMNKARSAAATVSRLNPDIDIEIMETHLHEAQLSPLLQRVDLVVDATDNYPIRFALNRACIAARIPMVSGAAVRSEGQVAVFDPGNGGPCYACLYQESDTLTALSCSDSGVLAPLVGVVGSYLAMEALKVLSGYGKTLSGRLLVLDLAQGETQALQLPVRADCMACAALQAER